MRILGTLALVAGAFAQYDSSTMTTKKEIARSQYWHEKYHGLLSMAAYGDYATLCPKTFTKEALHKSFPDSTEDPWTIITTYGPTSKGIKGFAVKIPEMDKVVMVFVGKPGYEAQLDHSVVDVSGPFYLGSSCKGCTANKDAFDAYIELKQSTNNFAAVADAVRQSGHQWSVTGHGFGGMVAQVAALDQGYAGRVHWTHNHGSPRVFNYPAAQLYGRLFGGESGQRTVANNDVLPTLIPASENYYFVSQGFHIWGKNSIYGMNYKVCFDAGDSDCHGGSSQEDSSFYYTKIGTCG